MRLSPALMGLNSPSLTRCHITGTMQPNWPKGLGQVALAVGHEPQPQPRREPRRQVRLTLAAPVQPLLDRLLRRVGVEQEKAVKVIGRHNFVRDYRDRVGS